MVRVTSCFLLFWLACGCTSNPHVPPSQQVQNSEPSDDPAAVTRAGGWDTQVLPGATQFKYTVGDEAGNALAYGVLIIPWPIEDGQNFRGTWQARPVLLPVSDKPAETPKIGPQLGGGQLSGSREADTVRISLNPNMNDNNVTLIGEIDGDKFRGTWEWSTFTGASAKGKFAATRAD